MTELGAQYYFTSPDEAEEAFYLAFETRDLKLMSLLLSDKDAVCVHPSAFALIGREQIIDCWKQVFSVDLEHFFKNEVLSKSISNDIAVHVVAEKVFDRNNPESNIDNVIATNIYIHQKNGWRLLSHHASFFKKQGVPIENIEGDGSNFDKLRDSLL